jgi:chemotaxis protein MotB
MSLLLTFFILLLSFATMEKPEEAREALIAIRGSFGVLPMELTAVQVNPMPKRMKKLPEKAEDAARDVQREIQVAGQADAVKMQFDDSGALRINLPEDLLFDVGQTTLKQDAYLFLSGLSEILAQIPDVFYEIEGHSDNTTVGAGGAFADNLHLSYLRADAVARYLSQYGKIPLNRMEIMAAGSGRPIASNTTAEGRRANRRVEIYVKGLLTMAEVQELQQRVDRLTK